MKKIILKQISEIYYGTLSKLNYLILIIGLIYLLSRFFITQPYYNNTINILRSGTWSMIIVISSIILISKIYDIRSNLYTLFILLIGIIAFFIGIYSNKYISNKKINSIYIRFKTIDIFKYNDNNNSNNKSVKSLTSTETSNSNNLNHNYNELSSTDSSFSDYNNNSNEQTVNEENNNINKSDSNDTSTSTSSYSNNIIPIHEMLEKKIHIFDKINDICRYYYT